METDRLKSQIEMIEKYKTVFNSPVGQEVLVDLAKASGAFTSSFDVDANVMAYAEGAKSFFLRILSTLNTDTVQLMKMYEDTQPTLIQGESNE